MDVLLAEHLWRQILLGAAGESAGKCVTEPSAVLRSMNVSDAKVCEMGPATFVKNYVLCIIKRNRAETSIGELSPAKCKQ